MGNIVDVVAVNGYTFSPGSGLRQVIGVVVYQRQWCSRSNQSSRDNKW
ncbi:MAG: hypothetical protein IPH17_05650 [Bacteroidales bacterium]|nr:hypothetical protein [Bacteroidales bacterium]